MALTQRPTALGRIINLLCARRVGQMSLTRTHITKIGGFTLVEVLAAVLILSIALLTIMTASSVARDSQQRAVCQSIARNLAQSIIEQIRSAPIESMSTMTFPSSDTSLPSGNTIAVSVAGYPSSSNSDLCKATVIVRWPEASNTRTVKYETLIVRR